MSFYVGAFCVTIITKGRDTMNKTKIPKNSKELEKRINKYFKSRLAVQYGKNGEVLVDEKGKPLKKQELPYTLTGLALSLGLDSREALFEFKDEKMQKLVRMAIMKIEEYAEEKLFCKEAFSGVKLFLSVNFDRWQDREGDDTDEEYIIPEEAKKWSV